MEGGRGEGVGGGGGGEGKGLGEEGHEERVGKMQGQGWRKKNNKKQEGLPAAELAGLREEACVGGTMRVWRKVKAMGRNEISMGTLGGGGW